MKVISSFVFLFFLPGFISCKKIGLFNPAGKTIIKVRTATPFNKIILNDNINLVLTQDSIYAIKVEAGENLQSSITTEINNQSLTIKNGSAGIVNVPGQIINVYASVRDLKEISYQGSGNITGTNTLNSPYFLIYSNTGAGNVHLSINSIMTTAGIYNENADFIFEGNSDSCYTYCSSRGTIDFKDFTVTNFQIDYSGARDAYVSATNKLKGNIFYKGNVYYKGSPSLIDVKQRDSGKLLHL